MADLNAVEELDADLYAGDDQPIWFTPTADADDSLAVADWTVVARFYRQRFTTVAPLARVAATASVSLSYHSATASFRGTLAAATLATFQAGLWTLDIWRTNSGAVKLLCRVRLKVYSTISA